MGKTTKKNRCTVFEQGVVIRDSNNVERPLDGPTPAGVDKDRIYLGPNGNWTVAWKKVELVSIDPDNTLTIQTSDNRVFECYGANPHTWPEFSKFCSKQWDKRQRKRNSKAAVEQEASHRPSILKKSPARRGRTYGGGNRYSYSGTSSTLRKRQERLLREAEQRFSDDEDEEQETVAPPPHETPEGNDADVVLEKAWDDGFLADPSAEDEESTPILSRKKRRLDRKGAPSVLHDDTDDEDEMFGSTAPVTTPATNNLVSPPNENSMEIDHDDEETEAGSRKQSESNQAKKTKHGDKPLTPSDAAGTRSISSFFQAKPKTQPKSLALKLQPNDESVQGSESLSKKFAKEQSPVAPSKKRNALSQDTSWLEVRTNAPRVSPERRLSSTPSTPPPSTPEHNLTPQKGVATSSPTTVGRLKHNYRPGLFRYRRKNRLNVLQVSAITDEIEDSDDDNGAAHQSRAMRTLDYASKNANASHRSISREFRTESRMMYPKNKLSLVARKSYGRPYQSNVPWKGLFNQGNTCYLNASMQMLYTVQSFVAALEPAAASATISRAVVSLAHELRDLPSMKSGTRPTELKAAIDAATNKFRGHEQRDAHEFLSDLLDRIHEEWDMPVGQTDSAAGEGTQEEKALEAAPGKDGGHTLEKQQTYDEANKENEAPPRSITHHGPFPTDEYFRTEIQGRLKCDCCGYERTKNEIYRHLSIEVEQPVTPEKDIQEDGGSDPIKWTIEKGLQKFFEPEKREINCEKCSDGKTATQTLSVVSSSKALVIHLKRFVVVEKPRIRSHWKPPTAADEKKPEVANDSANTAETVPEAPMLMIQKIKAPVVLDPSVSLNQFFMNKAANEGPASKYELKSVVHHLGSTADSGHYTAHAYRDDALVHFDDGLVSKERPDVLKSELKQRSAYMLLYTLETK